MEFLTVWNMWNEWWCQRRKLKVWEKQLLLWVSSLNEMRNVVCFVLCDFLFFFNFQCGPREEDLCVEVSVREAIHSQWNTCSVILHVTMWPCRHSQTRLSQRPNNFSQTTQIISKLIVYKSYVLKRLLQPFQNGRSLLKRWNLSKNQELVQLLTELKLRRPMTWKNENLHGHIVGWHFQLFSKAPNYSTALWTFSDKWAALMKH